MILQKLPIKNKEASFYKANKKVNTCFVAEQNKLFAIRFYTLNENIPSKFNYVKTKIIEVYDIRI